ncbi:hypothetical protein ABZ646_27855, partial [Streptomyces sp. NPDC007162]|uniref:hypothetical protein n=1 Tax=Streptomyces sp. NPDC007162 TaxID=3156917 RepID=UPI0033E4F068
MTLLVVVLVVVPFAWILWVSVLRELQFTRVWLTCASAPVQVTRSITASSAASTTSSPPSRTALT